MSNTEVKDEVQAPKKRQSGFSLPDTLLRAVKIEAIRDGVSLGEWAEKVLGAELDRRGVAHK